MDIKFYLVAEGLKIRERFECRTGQSFAKNDGTVLEEIIDGHVDDDIKREHPEAYAKFAALVEAQKDALYAEARRAPGSKVIPVPVVVPAKIKSEEEVIE
jgi:hypothetical protein